MLRRGHKRARLGATAQLAFGALLGVGVIACNAPAETPGGEPRPVVDAGGAVARLHFEEVGMTAGVAVRFDFDDSVVDVFWSEQEPPRNELIGMIGGVAADDFNGDGFTDLFVLGGQRGGFWLENDRRGGFDDVTDAIGAETDEMASGPVLADFDGDGRSDLLLGGIGERKVQLLRNTPSGFVDVTDVSGLTQALDTVGFGVGDVDSDGDLDILAARWGKLFYPAINDPALKMRGELLWLNDGEGRFSDRSELLRYPLRATRFTPAGELSEVALTPNFADLDDDGDPDLLLTQDFMMSTVMRNETLGGEPPRFVDITDRRVVDEDNGMGSAIGDYDNDGDLDWFVSSISGDALENAFYTGNRLYKNAGDGTFEDATDEAGVRLGSWGWGACFADFDNDGFLDLFHVNGWGRAGHGSPGQAEYLEDAARLFLSRSDSRGAFEQVAGDLGIADTGQGRGVVCFDYDRDGDIDVMLTNSGGRSRLYANQLNPHEAPGANYLTVRLLGPISNRRGIGTRLWLTTLAGTQLREVRIQNNYVSQDPPEAHFGVGSAQRVSSLRVRWPDGREQTLTALAVNHVETVRAH